MMTSLKKIEANRRNASRSTGPRTAEGKTRASRNAVKHGLASIGSTDPEMAHEVEALACAIAGEDSNGDRQAVAREAAAAWIALQRAKAVQAALLDREIAVMERACPAEGNRYTQGMRISNEAVKQAAAVDRYIRRAQSRCRPLFKLLEEGPATG